MTVENHGYDILLAEPLDDSAAERLAGAGRLRFASAHDEETLVREIGQADALLVRTYADVTAEVIEAAPRLKVIGRAGVGLENVDLAAARRRGVVVVHTPAAASDSVAELTVGLMLALERHLVRSSLMLHENRFGEARRTLIGRELGGLTLGIIGMGRIGRRVGRICHCGLRMTVLYNDILDITGLDFPAEPTSKERVWAESDVVSLHVPLTDLTRRLICTDVLARFKPGATLINTCRGAVVDSVALANALHTGALAAAALDVHDPEPPPEDSPLRTEPNALLTPHIAARTATGLARMNDVVDDVLAVLAGRQPQYPAEPLSGA